MNIVIVEVTITQNDSSYTWSFQSDYAGFEKKSGRVTLQETGTTQILYRLDPTSAQAYNLIYVNLDPDVCATHEFLQVTYVGDTIAIIDSNSAGATGSTPISLRLIAREAGNIGAPIISPDPTVDNDPPNTSTCP